MKKYLVIHIFECGDYVINSTSAELNVNDTVITSGGPAKITEVIPERDIFIAQDLTEINYNEDKLLDIRDQEKLIK